MQYLLSFQSTHAAINAEKLLSALDPKVIPTPRNISAGCGISLLLTQTDATQIIAALNKIDLTRDIEYALYELDGTGWTLSNLPDANS